jgi:hypothetical protein
MARLPSSRDDAIDVEAAGLERTSLPEGRSIQLHPAKHCVTEPTQIRHTVHVRIQVEPFSTHYIFLLPVHTPMDRASRSIDDLGVCECMHIDEYPMISCPHRTVMQHNATVQSHKILCTHSDPPIKVSP